MAGIAKALILDFGRDVAERGTRRRRKQ
jgi:hypothetical protein